MNAETTGDPKRDAKIQAYIDTILEDEGEKNNYKTADELLDKIQKIKEMQLQPNSDKRKRRVHRNRRTQRKRLNRKTRSTRRRY